MTTILKHIRWSTPRAGGKFAVLLDGGMLIVAPISKACPPASAALAATREVLAGEEAREMLDRAVQQNRGRIHPAKVTIRTGMSGCVDFGLVYLTDLKLAAVRTAASLHVSMEGKVNNPWGPLALMDFIVVAGHMARHKILTPGEGEFWEVLEHLPSVEGFLEGEALLEDAAYAFPSGQRTDGETVRSFTW